MLLKNAEPNMYSNLFRERAGEEIGKLSFNNHTIYKEYSLNVTRVVHQ